jgi:glycosyltransferase involved in cell wall biosynthesis
MKKICFFVGDMNHSGGTERVSTLILNELHQAEFEVHVVNLAGGEKPFFPLADGVHSTCLGNVQGGGIKAFSASVANLRRYLKKHSIDTLIAVESMLTLYAVPASTFLDLKLIVWEHFNFHVDLGKRVRRIARQIAALTADTVVTLTERDKMFWQSESWCRANIMAIANPVPFTVSEHQPEPANKTFLAVGRLTYQKGFDLLLAAWKPVTEQHPDWTLQIVGSGEDDQSLTQLVTDLDLARSVQLVPATPDVQAYYKKAVYYVMSSRFEGLPMVLLEALSFGLPIVSFDCDTGPSDIVVPGKNGWLCKADSVSSLTSGMISAIEASDVEHVYASYSSEAKAKCGEFYLDAIMKKWIGLIDDNVC